MKPHRSSVPVVAFLIILLVASASSTASAADVGWQPVVAGEAATPGGFGDVNNISIGSIALFKGQLYAGCSNFIDGVEIWRSSDGLTWEPCVGPNPALISAGFGQGAPVSFMGELIVYNNGVADTLYCGVGTPTGCQVWSSTDGRNWTQEVGGGTPPALDAPGFGNLQNQNIDHMAVFMGALWASATNSITGTQIFYSFDGSTWFLSLDDGFNDDYNVAVFDTAMFSGSGVNRIYVGLLNGNPSAGCAIVESADATWWDYSVGSSPIPGGGSSITPNGFYPNSDNLAVSALAVFKGQLYAGTLNAQPVTTELWRTGDGWNWSGASLDGYGLHNSEITWDLLADPSDAYLLASTGAGNAGVFGSTDGANWIQLNLPGFSPANNNSGVTNLIMFNGYVYGTTSNGVAIGGEELSIQDIGSFGAEIWRTGGDSIRTGLGLNTPQLPYTGR